MLHGRGVRGRVHNRRGRRLPPRRTRTRTPHLEEAGCIAPRSRSRRTRSTPTRRSPTPTAATSTATASRSINLMSAPGAGKTTPARGLAARSRRPARRRARGRRAGLDGRGPPLGDAHPRRPDQHRQRLRRRVPPRREHGPHRAARPDARRDRPADRRERRQPRLPGRVQDRRGRQGDGHLGHRGRGQAAQVPADVPLLRARRRSTRSTCSRTSTSTSRSSSTTSTPSTRASRTMLVSAKTGEGVDAFREWLVGGRGASAGPSVSPPRRLDRAEVLGGRIDELLAARVEANEALLRAPRPSRLARALPPDGRALRPRRAGWSRWASRPRRAPTSATSPSSSCTR